MGAVNKDSVLGASLVLSVVSLVLLFGVTWYFQSSITLLQQQVLQLQDQVNTKSHKENRIHSVVRRQLGDGCQCKDGAPGPRGLEGRKGEQGLPGVTGTKGEIGEIGPTGLAGDQGFPGMKGRQGEKGNQGDQGFPGPRGGPGGKGSQGYMGPKGIHGDKGAEGAQGEVGNKGDKGDLGEKGNVGDKGEKGGQGEVGNSGEKGEHGTKGDKGIEGLHGISGTPGEKGDEGGRGPRGHKGIPGVVGLKGLKGERGSEGPPGQSGPTGALGEVPIKSTGTVYVRWGHDQCPSSADLVYSGRAGGSHFSNKGGGSNPQCLPLDPSYLSVSIGKDDHFTARMYGSEYQLHRSIGRNSHQSNVPCAVCHVNRTAMHMIPAKPTCPDDWTLEYFGYLMAERWDNHRSQFTCVDETFKPVPGSTANEDGMLFYPVEGRCGSLPCPPYDESRELTCAVCTK